jgi:hypothetical protein
MGLGVFLPEKFDDTFLFDFSQIEIINMRSADKPPMPTKISRLSSIT